MTQSNHPCCPNCGAALGLAFVVVPMAEFRSDGPSVAIRAEPSQPAAAPAPMVNGKLALSLKEAAKAMGVGETTMRELVARREVPTVTAGRRVLVPVKGLQDWMERRQER